MEFKDKLANLLQEKGMSQKELAQLTNLTESAISRYLKGDRQPRGAILLNIANALGTTTDYFLGKTETKFNSDSDFDTLYRLLARNSKNMSPENKAKLAKILFTEE